MPPMPPGPPMAGPPPEGGPSKKKKGTSKKHGYFSNLKFIVSNQWKFRKSYIISVLSLSPFRALTSVIAAFLPKIILDCIEQNIPPVKMFIKVSIAVAAMIISEALVYALNANSTRDMAISENELFKMMLFQKTIDMDYNNYIYNETRVMKEKANQGLKGWVGSVCTCITHNSFLFTSLFGFSAFTAIIARCNIMFIPILVVSYGASCFGWFLLQRYRDKRKDEWSGTFLKLNYMTFRSKDFSNAKDIRVYNMAGFLKRKTDKHVKESDKIRQKMENGHLINVTIEDVLKCVISLGAYAYLINMKLTKDMSLGDFSLYFGAITGFGTWLTRLVDSVSDVLECDHSIDDFRTFLEIEDKMTKEGGVTLPEKKDYPLSIELKNLTFSYDKAKEPTIKNFNLKINPGERVAIVGVNGAGKSTLVKLISGLFIARSGDILINGTDSRKFNRDEYYSLFSTVFQDVSLVPSTVAKNIALCEEDKIDHERLWKCMALAGIDEKVKSLPNKENALLIREVNEGATSFSGGELQRLLLARALYKDSPIMILDEPTAALDPIAENNMYLKYSELTKGKTSIYISHRLSSTRFCDRIILLSDNEIAEVGTHDELIALGGKYAEMFEIQSQYYRDEEVEL